MARTRTAELVCFAYLIFFCTLSLNFVGNRQHLAAIRSHQQARQPVSQIDGYEEDEHAEYVPGIAEEAVLQLADALGFDKLNNPATCFIWDQDTNSTPAEFRAKFAGYREGLQRHWDAVNDFEAIPSLKESIKRGGGEDVCDRARLPPDGVAGFFPPGQLSLGKSGHVEPLLPPMRHPKTCENHVWHLNIEYLVHDFEAMCRKLRPHSSLVFIDMGAAMNFQGGAKAILWLLGIYEKFGFHFDHIYGFELQFTEPKTVYERLIPEKYMHSYHWINAGVSREKGNKLNPLDSVIRKYDEDDFIVVKLDIDTASVELPLARQLLEDDIYSRLIDQFYFEHHVHLGEMKRNWQQTMEGSIKDSLELFSKLREKGIPAHYWI